MNKREAYEYLVGAWSAAESEFGGYNVDFDDCLRTLGVSEETLEKIRAEEKAVSDAMFAVSLEEGEEMCRAGVWIRVEPKVIYYGSVRLWSYQTNDEFFNRNPVEFRRRRNEIMEKYKPKKREAKEAVRRKYAENPQSRAPSVE